MFGWCWHKWGRWKILKRGILLNEKGVRDGFYIDQERTCEKCFKTEIKRQES